MHAAHSESSALGLPFGCVAGAPPPLCPVVVVVPMFATDGDFEAPHPATSRASPATLEQSH
jgi:hypothetical protein